MPSQQIKTNNLLKMHKIFLSYSHEDSEPLHIKEIAEKLEKSIPTIKTRYYERDKKAGQSVLEHMDRNGV